ncbi:MAG: choice-of-anchor W domain-containing protein [Phycisphaerales bacterium]
MLSIARTAPAIATAIVCLSAGSASAGLFTGHIDTDAQFNALGLIENAVAEGRIGNNALNGTHELDLGPDTGAPAQTAQHVWGNGVDTPFSLTFAPGSGIITFALGGKTLNYGTVSEITGIYIRTRATQPGTSVSISNLILNADPIAGASSADGSADGTDYFFITGNQLLSGFTLTGDANLAWGTLPTNSNLAFQIKLTVPTPATTGLLAIAGIAATRRRR